MASLQTSTIDDEKTLRDPPSPRRDEPAKKRAKKDGACSSNDAPPDAAALVQALTGQPITRAMFERYVSVQKSGHWNMFDERAQRACGVTDDEVYASILTHYDDIKRIYAVAPTSNGH